ncbi:lipopolysaccharide biosynthesis protein [Tenuifilum thalassicum]|uniref:lipopolysaccharide biosynthesis protein n=1 Tax=Tenuifilum thalassicum TaxID=2590900 RepID=UPI00156748E1|nr:MATE family efflux transporter [Tenuifilum thalassicum]
MKITFLKNFFLPNTNETRSIKANKNALFSLFLKAAGIVIGLVLVPVSLNFLDTKLYGVWIAIYSILFWLSYFDLGLGHGLRNYLAKSLAQKKIKLAKEYISTTYFLLSVIFTLLAILLLFFNHLIYWPDILNCPEELSQTITQLMSILIIVVSIRFVFQIVIQVYEANQRVAFGSLINTIGQTLSLLLIILLPYFQWENKLLVFGSITTSVPVVVLLFFTAYTFRYKYTTISPSVNYIKLSHSNKLLSVGFKFLIIQISILIITQLPNIIISHHFGPERVTLFFTTQKYFSVIYMIYSTVIKSYWPFTEAYTKNDFNWIKKHLKIYKNNFYSRNYWNHNAIREQLYHYFMDT